jgi:hypothetical protein
VIVKTLHNGSRKFSNLVEAIQSVAFFIESLHDKIFMRYFIKYLYNYLKIIL